MGFREVFIASSFPLQINNRQPEPAVRNEIRGGGLLPPAMEWSVFYDYYTKNLDGRQHNQEDPERPSLASFPIFATILSGKFPVTFSGGATTYGYLHSATVLS
jgi:hypothetical protein